VALKLLSLSFVNEILLCTHNPLLIKSFYGILVNEGFNVEIADHSALAVQMVLERRYAAVLIDSESFGLPAEDAVQIMRDISSDMPIIVTGNNNYIAGAYSVKTPVDLEEFRYVIHSINRFCKISKN
jgi:DNA-binding NtrC family response regulator